MEAKDTVTKTNVYNCHNTLEERLAEQASISFEAGKEEGKKETVEWVKKNAGLGVRTIEELNTGYSFIPIRSDKWQAKLKEWGI